MTQHDSAAQALREAADAWTQGEWANHVVTASDPAQIRIGSAQRFGEWLRARADSLAAQPAPEQRTCGCPLGRGGCNCGAPDERTPDVAAVLHAAIWDRAQTNAWPIVGDDFPAAEYLAACIFAAFDVRRKP